MGKILTGHEGNLASTYLDLHLPRCSVFLPVESSKGIPTAPSAVICASKERVEPRGHKMLLRKEAGNANPCTLFPGQGREWSSFHTLADPILTTAQSQLSFSPFYRLKKNQLGKGDSVCPRSCTYSKPEGSWLPGSASAGMILASVKISIRFCALLLGNWGTAECRVQSTAEKCLFPTPPKVNNCVTPPVLITWRHQHCHLSYKTVTKT